VVTWTKGARSVTLEEAQPKNKLDVFEIGMFVIDLAVIAAIVYVMINCISNVVETSYFINGPNFMP
jgi:hypothetical protein